MFTLTASNSEMSEDDSGSDMSMMNPSQLGYQNKMAFARVCSLIRQLPNTDESYDVLMKITNDAKKYMAMRKAGPPMNDAYSPNLAQLLYGGQQNNQNARLNDSTREKLRMKLHIRNMNSSSLSNSENEEAVMANDSMMGNSKKKSHPRDINTSVLSNAKAGPSTSGNAAFAKPNDSSRGNSKKKLHSRDINTSSNPKAGPSTSDNEAFVMPNDSLRGNSKKKCHKGDINKSSLNNPKSGSSSSENEVPVKPNDSSRGNKKKKLLTKDINKSSLDSPKPDSSSSENEDPDLNNPKFNYGPARPLDVIPEIGEDADDSDLSTLTEDSQGEEETFLLKHWSLIKDNNNLYLTGTKFNRKGVQLQKNFVSEKVLSRPEKQLIKTKCGEYKLDGYLTDPKNCIPSEIKEIFRKDDCIFPKHWKKTLALWNSLGKTEQKTKGKPANKKNASIVKKNDKGKKPTKKNTKNADKSKTTHDPKDSSESEIELVDLPDNGSLFEIPSTSLTPSGLLASIKKISMHGRCTPPTNVFDNIYGKTTTPQSNSSAFEDCFEVAPKNVNVVKRMAKAKTAPSGTKPSGQKSKPANKGAVAPSLLGEENIDLIDEVLKSVKSNPTQTPELFKKVFRSKDEMDKDDITSDEESF